MLNTQTPEPRDKSDGLKLDIIEIFHTLQGEGPFTGQPAIFIRLAGCNLQCPGCDTIYTGPDRRTMTMREIADAVKTIALQSPNTRLAVITGGEPLRQNVAPLVRLLRSLKGRWFDTQIETNGVLPLSQELFNELATGRLHMVVSPKTKRIHESILDAARTCNTVFFKYVVSIGNIASDGLPVKALGHRAAPFVARPPAGWTGKIYINPCDDKDANLNRRNMEAARESALKFGYTLGVQLHKIVNVP